MPPHRRSSTVRWVDVTCRALHDMAAEVGDEHQADEDDDPPPCTQLPATVLLCSAASRPDDQWRRHLAAGGSGRATRALAPAPTRTLPALVANPLAEPAGRRFPDQGDNVVANALGTGPYPSGSRSWYSQGRSYLRQRGNIRTARRDREGPKLAGPHTCGDSCQARKVRLTNPRLTAFIMDTLA